MTHETRPMLPKRWSRGKRKAWRPRVIRMTVHWAAHVAKGGTHPPYGYRVTWNRDSRTLMCVLDCP